jgi:hypothetical protein
MPGEISRSYEGPGEPDPVEVALENALELADDLDRLVRFVDKHPAERFRLMAYVPNACGPGGPVFCSRVWMPAEAWERLRPCLGALADDARLRAERLRPELTPEGGAP